MAGQFPQHIWIVSKPVQILIECKVAKTQQPKMESRTGVARC